MPDRWSIPARTSVPAVNETEREGCGGSALGSVNERVPGSADTFAPGEDAPSERSEVQRGDGWGDFDERRSVSDLVRRARSCFRFHARRLRETMPPAVISWRKSWK